MFDIYLGEFGALKAPAKNSKKHLVSKNMVSGICEKNACLKNGASFQKTACQFIRKETVLLTVLF